MLSYVQGRNGNCGCHDWLLFYEDFGRTGASSDASTGRCVPATAQHSIALIAPVLFSSAVRAGLSSSSAALYALVMSDVDTGLPLWPQLGAESVHTMLGACRVDDPCVT